MFFVHTTRVKYKNATVTVYFGFVLVENSVRKSHDYRDAIVFEKLRFQSIFHQNENVKPVSSKSSCFKSVFEKLRYLDGLGWTVRLTLQIKLRFLRSRVKTA